MMNDASLSATLFLALGLVITGTIVWGITQVPQIIKRIQSIQTTGVAEIDQLLKSAVEFATKLVEGMDQNGELTKALQTFKEKSQVKLELATDEAVKYIENILNQSGIEINIDEELIKKAIQQYVWDNPDIFPSKGNKPE